MDIDVVKQFIVLANHQNFSSAAIELHMSQPALSRNILLLEKELRHKLIARNQSSFLTSTGLYVLPRFHEIYDTWNRILEDTQHKAIAASIRIEDRAFLSRINNLLKETLSKVVSKHPLVGIEYVRTKKESVIDQVLEGAFDIGFIFDHNTYDAPLSLEFDAETLALLRLDSQPNKLMLAVSPDHPLAAKKGLRLEDLKHETFLKEVKNFAFSGSFSIERLCRRHGFAPKWKYVQSATPIEYLGHVENNNVVNLSEHSIETLIPKDLMSRFVVLDIIDEDIYTRDFLVYLKHNENPALIEFIRELECVLKSDKHEVIK